MNEVDIFRVAVGAAEEDLVERRAASEGKSGAKKIVREDGDERATDHRMAFGWIDSTTAFGEVVSKPLD